MTAVDLTEAYRSCERVTRSRAGNFYYGIRLLPPDKRRALCAVYAFARRIDDIGDGRLPAERKMAALEDARRALGRLSPVAADHVLAALADAAGRFPIPLSAFEDLIDGVAMDVRGTTYGTFDELVVYCRRVAGSIGRLSVGVFGSSAPGPADRLADDLGVAMQVTNVLRDIREDHEAGRCYVPAEDMARFGWRPEPGWPLRDEARATSLIRFEARRARAWFEGGLRLLPLLDRRSAACVGAMAGIYRRVLERIERRPAEVLHRRISLPSWEKALVAVRSLSGTAA